MMLHHKQVLMKDMWLLKHAFPKVAIANERIAGFI